MVVRRRTQLIPVITLSFFVVSCVTTQPPPISSSGAGFEPLKDELKLWQESLAEERVLLGRAPIYDDPELEAYLEDMVARLTPAGMAVNERVRYRVRVIEDPTLNAFAYPHGAIYVHTGLLARMENESQLATVLGHEMTHVEHRHTLRYRRSARNREVGFVIGAVAAAVILDHEEADALSKGDYGKALMAGLLGDVLVNLGLELAFVASVNGYGRDLEREADFGSFDKLADSGYDLGESPAVYELLQDGHGESGDLETFFFGSHPKLSQRVESARENLSQRPQATESSEATRESSLTFERRISPVLRDDARKNIELGRLELATFELERLLAWLPENGEAHLLVGQLKLAQADEAQDPAAKARLEEEAGESLRESVRLAPDRPIAHRELGLVAFRAEDFATACAELVAHVELAPDAASAQSIRSYLLELKRGGHCASP